MKFDSVADLRRACHDLPDGDGDAAATVAQRQAMLTKPAGSLGRLEEMVAWLARWQGTPMPVLDNVEVLVFAGNHGVVAQGVSAFPASVTEQMVANFETGGAAINQLSKLAGANLRVIPLSLDRPTADFTQAPAMEEAEFLEAVATGYDALDPNGHLVCLGEMGIGNTSAAAAISCALFGGLVEKWVGRGTGVDDEGLERKRVAVEAGLARHGQPGAGPLDLARALGGRELAAIMGAALAARHRGVPVLLDGFVSCAAAAPLQIMRKDALDHANIAHVSAEAGHRLLLNALGMEPVLDLGMRLGEASGAALGVSIYRAALACHRDMATFGEAAVDNRD
jgi:nicotinate-nucleotide--dimethylbenzimidazole phosphoribosyltransferase